MLKVYGFTSTFVQCVNLGQCKADYIEEQFGDVGLFIEDNPKHFDAVLKRKLAKKCFLVKRPWNIDYRKNNAHLNKMFVNNLADLYLNEAVHVCCR